MLSKFLEYFISKSYKRKQTLLKVVSLLPESLKIFLVKCFVNRYKRALDNLSAPPSVYFFITNRCNMRCKHCFFLDQLNKVNNELTLNEIASMAKSLKGKVPGMMLTGGEPFMREDLEQIIDCLVLQGGVKSISIATNGLLTKRILNIADRITQKHTGVQFGLQVSLDGPQPVHDRLRNKNGAYFHAMNTIKGLEKLQKQRSNLSTFINIVVSRNNADCFINFYRQLLDEREIEIMYHFIRQDWRDIHGLPKSLLWSTKEKGNLLPDSSTCNKIIDESEKMIGGGFLGKWRTILKKNHLKIANEGHQAIKCVAPKKGTALFADGGMSVCEVVRPCVNLRDYEYDFLACWRSISMENQRAELSHCFCTYPCALMDSMLYSEDNILQALSD